VHHWSNITVEKEDKIAVLTINRPKVLNSLNAETLAEIDAALEEMKRDSQIRALIITGAGDRAFIAGADIVYMSKLSPLEAKDFSRLGQVVFSKIENLPIPVIAAINGFALGGGCELACACDIRIASDKAKFGQPEVNLGLLPGFGGTQRLTRLVNPGLAKEIIFTADTYDVQFAQQIGLVNHIVPADELLSYCKDMAKRIAARGPVAVKLSKEAINEGLEMDVEKALIHEADLFGLVFTTSDHQEGMEAFINKRKPEFKNQ